MSGGRPPIEDVLDAMTWLGYFARFADGDLGTHSLGCLNVLVAMRDELEETRERCGRLASLVEKLEAAMRKGDAK